MQIKIVMNTLTGKSRTYDVLLIQDDQTIRLPATNRSRARLLQDIVAAAVEEHTAGRVI